MVAITLCPMYQSCVSTLSLSPGWEGWVLSPCSLSPAHNMALSFPLPFTNLLADLSAVNVPRTLWASCPLGTPYTTPVYPPEEQQLIVVNVCLVHFGVPILAEETASK